ncbi:MAG: triose-phosphate isomerase [Gemmatimonadetes bacterium]|nr:triose-phosphate isomerase [Gemmatimonadota bacterium]
MHLGPEEARAFLKSFLARYRRVTGREVWLFPPAVSLETVARETRDRAEIIVGTQNVHWDDKGAFTGELSVPMAKEAGARAALVGHSERRHVFGETEDDTAKKVRALLRHQVKAVLCVGEMIDQREAGQTVAVIERQLGALAGLDANALADITIAYEPVWAIGTGRNATPADAAQVHRAIRAWFVARGVAARNLTVLYGGSVKPDNIAALLAEPEIDGVLVGGASIDAGAWLEIVNSR